MNLVVSHVTDPSALAQSQSLEFLTLQGASFSDLSWVSRLESLKSLGIRFNDQMTDLSSLADAQNLESISISSSPVHDLSPLSGLPNLRHVSLLGTLVEDLSPLVNSPSLGVGDEVRVSLNTNPLSDEARNVQIPALRARGVIVSF
jgi:Leucine-rich repeat (LRR) protein